MMDSSTSSSPVYVSISSASAITTTTCTTPLALTISQAPSDSGDVFTLAYAADTSTAAFFGDNDVYSVPDTAMLLQAVDAIQFDGTDAVSQPNSISSNHIDEIASLSEYQLSENGDLSEVNLATGGCTTTTIISSSSSNHQSTSTTRYTPSRQLQAVLNSPLPESLAEFSALHSKDFVLYNCCSTLRDGAGSPTTQSSGQSPLPSPLAYPTPPASHEGLIQVASPFLDDSHHYSDGSSYFDEKKTSTEIHFLDADGSDQFFKDSSPHKSRHQDAVQIMKFVKQDIFNNDKNIMEESIYFKREPCDDLINFDPSKGSGSDDDLLTSSETNQDRSIAEFNQNLSFLDEPQNFLDDARNTSSPLSAAFFTATMSSAEEVKEALEEVLPNESVSGDDDEQRQEVSGGGGNDVTIIDGNIDPTANDMDLYYLPAMALQSQMMLNSDDPLLSSSPKDFVHKQHVVQKFDFNLFAPSPAKKFKNEIDDCKPPVPKSTLHTSDVSKDNFLNHPTVSAQSSNVRSAAITPTSTSSRHHYAIIRKRTAANASLSTLTNQRLQQRSTLFTSKFRRGAFTAHYTPQPMLNPERNATGLYNSITSSTATSSMNHDILDDDDEIDFDFTDADAQSGNDCNAEFMPNKSKVNIGSDFQAMLPALNQQVANSCYDGSRRAEELLWDPSVAISDVKVQRFVDLAKSSATPLGCHSEEVALRALYQAAGQMHVAILKLLQTAPDAMHNRWHQSEIEHFLQGLEEFGKDFVRISKAVRIC